ncbi:hypothetical protein SPRG_14006 [Saprolegnia parasitica CBS 223.65]|uniref:Uncharacterized protein n=1 Tax=Saprolegnia parasitica (strain CBS 223.65) TaxID=695850 RepID=A0A067BQE2_SAPPC|nr:hypothetical protein SPRG_14006 [Saprolegnia parasitica CBS 223.65]KDO20488.1 hypothetical protein SPRG_14006 [Saprolegnia parasitica CBS 223.65]|eukprot:XP_012208814.1 hypothetical protein SPRG_14006 [Saprolegnia parasitica CBS 223.65]
MSSSDTMGLAPSLLWSTTQATCMVGSIMFVAALWLRHMRKLHGGTPTSSKLANASDHDRMEPMVDGQHANDIFGCGLTLRDALNPVSSIDFNTQLPIPIETPLFHGKAYVLLRDPRGDPRWDPLFEGKQRRVWVMVQGQFKREPKGTVYLAGELPRTMVLSMWTKAWAGMIIASVKTLIGKLHFSFGDDIESPHVALPLYQSADQLVATPLEDVPPKLGMDSWGESPADQKARKATPVGDEVFRTDRIYSFQFHTMYVDLPSWNLVNLPGIHDVGLQHFFGDMSLRLSMYEHTPRPNEVAHITKEYCFAWDVARGPAPKAAPASGDCCPVHDTSFAGVEFDLWMWLEYFDATTDMRHLAYVLRVRLADSKVYTVILPSEAVLAIFAANHDASPLLTRARMDAYAAIEDQALEVGRRLQSIAYGGTAAAKAELYHWLTTPSPMTLAAANSDKALGVSLWPWRRAGMNVCKEGSGYRILSDTCLRQEYLILTSTSLQFYRTYASSPLRKVPISHMTHVGCRYLNDLFVLELHTWTEVLYVHVPDPLSWQVAIQDLCDRSPLRTCAAALQMTAWTPFNALTYEGYLVLNSRKIAYDVATTIVSVDPCLVAEAAVVAGARVWSARTRAHKLAFQLAVQELRCVDLSLLESSEHKLAFYLNAYQVLLMHLHLAIPEPTSVCMHQVMYEVGVQKLMLSLAELEHVMLRGGLCAVEDAPYLEFVPQKAAYPPAYSAVACSNRDFRLSAALCSHRDDKVVVVYAPTRVHDQLNSVVSSYWQARVVVGSVSLQLPLSCKWFRTDFGADDRLVRKLLGFLSDDQRSDVVRLLEAPTNLYPEFKDGAKAAPHGFSI